MTEYELVEDGNLAFFAKMLAEKEQAMADVAIKLEVSAMHAELLASPAWTKMVSVLQRIVDSEVQSLASTRMDDYHLGRRQGRINALNSICRRAPLQSSEIDTLREEATVLRTVIETYRNLLS